MPAEFWDEARQLATAGALVAAVAVPAGLAGWALGRRRPSLPAVKPWRIPWTGFELFGTFVVLMILIPMLFTRVGLRPLVIGLAALPAQLAFLVLLARVLYPSRPPSPHAPAQREGRNLPGLLAIGVGAWLVLTPLVLLFHALVLQVFSAMDWAVEEHPLTQFRNAGGLDQTLFLLQACVAAPLVEEILFRGLLLPWVVGARRHAPRPAPVLTAPAARPWLVLGIAVLFAAGTGKPGPTIFAGVLAGGLAVLWVAVRGGKRHARGVYATAALFAAVHSGVWPSPVPLFLLALGLGWLAVRTRGVFVPFVVHGLFNAVSAVYVLRGGAG